MLARTMVYYMSDFLVRRSNSQQKPEISFPSGRTSEYTKAKTQYRDMMERISGSDFANSPVALENEMNKLIEMLAHAKSENLVSEIKWIEPRLEAVKKQLTETKIDLIANAYYMPVFRNGVAAPPVENPSDPNSRIIALLNSCKTEDGLLDPNAEKLLTALKGKDDGLYHIKQVLEKSRDENGLVYPDMAEAVAQLAAVDVKPSRMLEHLATFSDYDAETGLMKIDFDSLGELTHLVSRGIDDVEAAGFVQYVHEGFEDKESVKESFLTLRKQDIDYKHSIDVLKALSVKNPETATLRVSSKSVHDVALLKKVMVETRDNEANERKNPIAKIGVKHMDMGDGRIWTFRDGHVISSPSLTGEDDPIYAQKKYDELISSIEDDMCVEFAKKYKDADGNIDRKYLRVAHQLRKNAGMVYNGLFNQVDLAIKPDGSINNDRLASIAELRKAGALCDDINILLDVCRQDEQGNYNKDDIKDICDLTSFVIDGEKVCSLAPEIRKSDEAKQIVLSCASCFYDRNNLLRVVDMLKKPDGEYGENEMEMFSNLFNVFYKDGKVFEDESFLNLANIVMTKSRGKDGSINDEAGGIVAIMKRADEPIENIINALSICQNEEGVVDEKLSEILWDMYVQDATFSEVFDMINVCKPTAETVDYSKAEMILALFNAKFPKDQILALVKH